MKIFIYKSLLVFFLTLILFKLTIGNLISGYEKKVGLILGKENLKTIEDKIRDEIKTGINKDRILSMEDAKLLNIFLSKIQKEIKGSGD